MKRIFQIIQRTWFPFKLPFNIFKSSKK